MSFKAYFVRCKNQDEVDTLNEYLKAIGDAGYLNFSATMKKSYDGFGVGDTIAAITVDRADLKGSFLEEIGKSLYSKRLDDCMTLYRQKIVYFEDLEETI